MLFELYNIIKRYINVIFYIVVIVSLLLVTSTFTYSRYTYHYETTVTVTVPASDKCKVYGADTLGECAILMDNTAETVDDAKKIIEAKTYDTSAIEPVVTYAMKTGTTSNSSQSDEKLYYFFILDDGELEKYFSKENGVYNFSDVPSEKYITMTMATYYSMLQAGEDLSNYYTSFAISRTNNHTVVSQITGINSTYTNSTSGVTTYYYDAITYSNSIKSTSASSPGLYATEDYNGGTTYFYRGEAENNYVSFAGYIWRIIRINEDGSVRMIYSGTSTTDTGKSTSITLVDTTSTKTSKFNTSYNDTTYVGYTYGENFTLIDESAATSKVTNNNISSTSIYYFSDSYSCTNDNGTYSCSLGDNQISGTWSSVYTEVIDNYPYTCLSTEEDGTCTKIIKVTAYKSASSATIIWLGWTSDALEDTYGDTDSTIKNNIDKWYAKYIEGETDTDGNSYSEYVVDEVFCGDRSTYSTASMTTSWRNNPITANTLYSPYYRLYTNRSPSLTCTNQEDRYMMDDTTGNGMLTYPVGLVTVDEVALAGGVYSLPNYKYYLHTDQAYWTMSPSLFNSAGDGANIWGVAASGYLYYWNTVLNNNGVRPVINISSSVEVASGTGTSSNPYTLKLNDD